MLGFQIQRRFRTGSRLGEFPTYILPLVLSSLFDTENSLTEVKRYEFALKTFAGNKYEFYKNEMDAFTALQGHEGMVRWLAEYEKVDQNGSKTYNILLEFGEMDLGDHFKRTLPPVLPLEIAAFWRSLFAVANAVEGVHDLKVRDDSGQTKEYHGQAIPCAKFLKTC